ncbi:MAG: DUF5717 family protein [Lachnospiraceae bacterium]|nr:DUF5717 family protein [Lachnospiraceae bacterium]
MRVEWKVVGMSDGQKAVSQAIMFSDIKIEHEMNANETLYGFFELEAEDEIVMEGFVISSSLRVRTEGINFRGNKVRIHYMVNTDGMRPGDTLKGNFSIVSNCGEHIMPFLIMIRHEVIKSVIGDIKNLFHFTNLAKTDWNDAVTVFYDPNFINILNGHDSIYRNLYKGLTKKGDKNYNLEEFLIGINKKVPIEYIVTRDDYKYSNPAADIDTTIDIERNGWGYTSLKVSTDCDFIELSSDSLTSEDFTANTCHLPLRIKADRLHAGKNMGRVIFRHLYGEVAVTFTVTNSLLTLSNPVERKKKSNNYGLTRHYLDYRLGLISRGKWGQLSIDIIEHNLTIDDGESLKNYLYKVYVLLVQENYNEAKWLLDHNTYGDPEEADNEIYAFYLYTLCLYNVDDYYSRQVCSQVKSIYDRDPENWRLAWVLMNLTPGMKEGTSARYSFMMDILNRGCISPLMYVEILDTLNANPSLLTGLDEKIIRVLYFGVCNGAVSEQLALQMAYQAERMKTYNKLIVTALGLIYGIYESDEILKSICVQLMRGDRHDHDSKEWYELALKLNLSITNLYECYMNSIDLNVEQEIPRSAVMYFSYDSHLTPEQTAYLYAYVRKNREKLSDIYDTYVPAMERFTVKQLYSGRLNKPLAYLYNELILGEMATDDNLREIAELLVRHRIEVDSPNITAAVVIDERLKEEMYYPLKNGVAYVDITSNDYTVLLEDAAGNRYYHTSDYVTERFFLPRKVIPRVERVAANTIPLNLFICEGAGAYIEINASNVERYTYLEQNEEITEEYRASIRMPLIRYYQESDNHDKIDELLASIGMEDVSVKDRDELLRVLVSRRMVDKALEYVVYYGPETIEPQILIRLTTFIIERDGYIESDELTSVIYSAFERGRYNETVLRYLVLFYKGLSKNLRNIWKAAAGFYVDTYDICETMITQTLKTGAYVGEEIQILKEYVDGGAKTDVEVEYLEYLASGFFVNDRMVDQYAFSEIARIYNNEGSIPDICILAYLKFYAENISVQELTPAEIRNIRRFIKILYVDKKVIMPFMKEFRGISLEALEISNQTMIEYRSTGASRVIINYCINKDDDDEEHKGFIREEMHHVYGGVFIKSVLLFFGETLQYYIVEEKNGQERLTESDMISCNEIDNDRGCDRYCLVNDIVIANVLGDYDAALELLEEYKYKEYIVDNFFRLQ